MNLHKAALTSLLMIQCLPSLADESESAVRDAFSLPDTIGTTRSTAEWKVKKAVVVLFLATECPVSNFYAPEFARLAQAYGEKGLLVYGVHCDPDVSAADAAKHAKEYSLTFPILLDPKQRLARALGATTTPEAVVLTTQGRMIYHGRIDDRYSLGGKRRDEPTRRDLEDAIRAALAGKVPETRETKAFGCLLPKVQK